MTSTINLQINPGILKELMEEKDQGFKVMDTHVDLKAFNRFENHCLRGTREKKILEELDEYFDRATAAMESFNIGDIDVIGLIDRQINACHPEANIDLCRGLDETTIRRLLCLDDVSIDDRPKVFYK